MRIVLAGASGFLGTTLVAHLRSEGHDVLRLVRGEPVGEERGWDPANGRLDPEHIADADAVINLGGAPIEHWPWTESYKQKILQSRLQTTGTLARTMAALGDASPALVNASGINYYGSDRGDELVDEESSPGDGFLAEVCRQWEAATQPAVDAGARVALMRTSLVLHRSGGVLKLIKIPFLAGVGGRLGNGQQFFPSISLDDYVAAATRLATDLTLSGPFNLVAPVAATNADFTAAMGHRLRRPTFVPVPAFALKAAVGELSHEMLGSVHATPRRLMEAGFRFEHPTVVEQVDAAFS